MISKLWIPVAEFFGGLACIIVAVATGGASVDLVVIFPVFSGSSPLFLLGILLIIGSFVIAFAMLTTRDSGIAGTLQSSSATPEKKVQTTYGGVVMVGPFPIAFGSNAKIAKTMLIIGVALAIALIVIFLLMA